MEQPRPTQKPITPAVAPAGARSRRRPGQPPQPPRQDEHEEKDDAGQNVLNRPWEPGALLQARPYHPGQQDRDGERDAPADGEDPPEAGEPLSCFHHASCSATGARSSSSI